MRHPEKEMSGEEIEQVLADARLMTLAMCKEGSPYLVTVNFAYDPDRNCFYFHCAKDGKKMDYMGNNLAVWGQILEDGGYVQGQCEHRYRCVHFKGRATVLEDDGDIRESMVCLIEQQEDDPDPVKKRNIETGKYAGAAMVRIDVDAFTGKRGE